MKDKTTQTDLFGSALQTENRMVKLTQVVGLDNLLPGTAGTSISVLGLLQDPLLHEFEKGKYRVRSGEGRVSALHAKKVEEFSAKVIPFESDASPAALAAATIVTNLCRRRNPVAEGRSLARALQMYADDQDAQVHEVRDEAIKAFASAYGVTPGQLESLYNITLLPPQLLAGYDEGNIAPSIMERLAKKSEEFQLRAVEELEEVGQITGPIMKELQLAIDDEVSKKMAKAAPGMFGRVEGYLENSAGPAGIESRKFYPPGTPVADKADFTGFGKSMGIKKTASGLTVAMPVDHIPFDEGTDAGRTIHIKGFELDNPGLAEPYGGDNTELLEVLRVITHKARASHVKYLHFVPAFLESLDTECRDIVLAFVALWYLENDGTVRRGRELLKDALAMKKGEADGDNYVLRVSTEGVQRDAGEVEE